MKLSARSYSWPTWYTADVLACLSFAFLSFHAAIWRTLVPGRYPWEPAGWLVIGFLASLGAIWTAVLDFTTRQRRRPRPGAILLLTCLFFLILAISLAS